LGIRTAQFVSLARALAREPDLLLLDAPCTFLDPPTTARFDELLLKLGNATAVVMSTNSLDRAKRLSDYIVMLEDGQLVDLVTLFEGQRHSFTEHPISGLRHNQCYDIRVRNDRARNYDSMLLDKTAG
ncbi:MAG: hypothetical protein ACOC0B_02135, partial [bacterium]